MPGLGGGAGGDIGHAYFSSVLLDEEPMNEAGDGSMHDKKRDGYMRTMNPPYFLYCCLFVYIYVCVYASLIAMPSSA